MSLKFPTPKNVKSNNIIACLAWVILLFVLLCLILSLKIWVSIVVVLPGLLAVIIIYRQYLVRRSRRRRIYAAHCERLETLVHDIIDLAYVYDEDHTKFYLKFLETVSIDSLSRRGIINPDALLRTSKFNQELKAMKRSDAELLALLLAGFSNREIKVICGLKNMNSVYIKCHRLRNRLSKRMKQILDS